MLKTLRPRLVSVFAGVTSVLTYWIEFDIKPEDTPLGICTSSGTIGHSLSFGRADAVIAFSPSTSLADAAATAIGNRVRTVRDIPGAIEFARSIRRLSGVVIIKEGNMGLWGQIRLAEIDSQ